MRRTFAICLLPSLAALWAASATELPAPTSPPAQNSRVERHVIEVDKGEKFSTATFHIGVLELRELIYRLLDEDGFRVKRSDELIPENGLTLKARKKLRNVEVEVFPGRQPGYSSVSFEYSRFGNRGWAERALNMLVADLEKRDPPAPKGHAIDNTPEERKPAEKIERVDYFEPVAATEEKKNLPIPALTPDGSKDAPGVDQVLKEQQARAAASRHNATAAPELTAIATGNGAEVVELPGQSPAPALPQPPAEDRTRGTALEMFRSIQRGDVTKEAGQERVGVYLEIHWADGKRPPDRTARNELAACIAEALACRRLASVEACAIVDLLDYAASAGESDSTRLNEIGNRIGAKLKASDLDESQREKFSKAVEAIFTNK